MDKITIGILAVAVIVVVGMFNGIDGVLAMSGLSAIGGLLGYKVKTVTDATSIGRSKVTLPKVVESEHEVKIVKTVVPVAVPRIPTDKTIDFAKIESDLREEIKSDGFAFTWAALYRYAHTRAVFARVKNIREVIEWNTFLSRIARSAFRDAFGVECPLTYDGIDAVVDQWKKDNCQGLRGYRKIAKNWVERLMGHREALTRLESIGIDWSKIGPQHNTAWMVGELAFNPREPIGFESEDV